MYFYQLKNYPKVGLVSLNGAQHGSHFHHSQFIFKNVQK